MLVYGQIAIAQSPPAAANRALYIVSADFWHPTGLASEGARPA